MKRVTSFALLLLAAGSANGILAADCTAHVDRPTSAEDFYCLGVQNEHQNEVESARSYRRAADMGHSGAQNVLGYLYASGRGVPQNYAEALKWYRRAADQGNTDSMYAIGGLYAFGRGVPKDDQEAGRWFERANRGPKIVAQAGHSVFDEGERQYRESKEPPVVPRAPNTADVEYQTGYRYEHGEGLPKNLEQAARWYSRAATAGDPRAQFNLGRMYATGQGVPEDLTKAVDLWIKSAQQGNSDALVDLREAAQRGNPRAKSFLDCADHTNPRTCVP